MIISVGCTHLLCPACAWVCVSEANNRRRKVVRGQIFTCTWPRCPAYRRAHVCRHHLPPPRLQQVCTTALSTYRGGHTGSCPSPAHQQAEGGRAPHGSRHLKSCLCDTMVLLLPLPARLHVATYQRTNKDLPVAAQPVRHMAYKAEAIKATLVQLRVEEWREWRAALLLQLTSRLQPRRTSKRAC